MNNRRHALHLAAGALVAISLALLGDPNVDKEHMGPAPQSHNDIVQSPDGSRIAWVTMSGSRYAAIIDGEMGPEFDAIVPLMPAGSRTSRDAVTFYFSEDGSRVAYVGRRGGEYVLVIDGEPGPSYPQPVATPTFSDDGAVFVYAAPIDAPEGQPAAQRQHMAPHQLVIDGEPAPYRGVITGLAVSPTGRYILFDLRSAEGGQESRHRYLLDNGEVISRTADPPPGGGLGQSIPQWAWFADEDRHIAFIERIEEAGSSGERVVHNGVPGKVYAAIAHDDFGRLHLAEDGQRVAYVASLAEGGGRQGAGTVLVLNGEEKSLEGRAAAGAPAPRGQARPTLFISADARRYAYERDTGHGRQYVIDGEAGPEYDIVRQFVFSPDGRGHAYTAQQGARGGRHFVIVDGQESGGYEGIEIPPFFSPNGSRYAYVGREGREEHRVVIDGNGVGTYYEINDLVFSPDGSRVAFGLGSLEDRQRHRGYYVDGHVTMLGPAGRTHVTGPIAFSPDGQRVAITTGFYTTFHNVQLIVEGQEHPAFHTFSSGPKAMPIFSPDGRHVVYRASDETRRRFLVLDGEAMPGNVQVTTTAAVLDYVFLPDGRLQYYALEDGEIYRYRVTPGGADEE